MERTFSILIRKHFSFFFCCNGSKTPPSLQQHVRLPWQREWRGWVVLLQEYISNQSKGIPRTLCKEMKVHRMVCSPSSSHTSHIYSFLSRFGKLLPSAYPLIKANLKLAMNGPAETTVPVNYHALLSLLACLHLGTTSFGTSSKINYLPQKTNPFERG